MTILRFTATARRAAWALALLLALALYLLLTSGCATARTIYVPDGEPVRLRSTIRRARVWTRLESGEIVAGRMDLPEGWYVLPDPGAGE